MRNLTRGLFAGMLIAGLAGNPALPADKSSGKAVQGEEASIPFVDHGNVRDWQADGRDGLWLQDNHRQWYYAKTLGPCIGLDFAWAIKLDARPGNSFDRFGSIILPGEHGRCALQSLTHSKAPPKRQKKPAKPEAAETN